MLTFNDERTGLVKTNWDSVRSRVHKVAPEFAKLVDKLSPDKSFHLYLAYYPYGELIGDTVSPFLPMIAGGNYRLSDANAPKDIIKNLGYGQNSSPLGMLLEKSLEYYIDLKKLNISIPWQIYSPGSFFPLARFLKNKSGRTYSPNGLLTVVSGTRSAFMLPKIGSSPNHLMLRRHYNNVRPKPPKDLSEHWQIFKDIINSNHSENDWRSCVLYFSQKWLDKIHNDNEWAPVKGYFLELASHKFEYEKNQIYYNIAYSLIQYSNNLKPNPYLIDTACHLFAIGTGAVPGYSPAIDDHSLPLDLLQNAFVESYGLKKYIPTIMQPHHFNFEDALTKPIYYSLNHPSTLSFSPKSRKDSSTLFEMDELMHIVNIFQKELSHDNNILSDTVISEIAKNVEFNFFHNRTSTHDNILDSDTIINFDSRFAQKNTKFSAPESIFSSDAPFLRGCIGIKVKSKK